MFGPMSYRRVSKRGNLPDFSRLSPACTRAICRGYRADGPGDEVGLVRSTMLKSSGKCYIYGKSVRNTNKVSLRFLLRDTLHEALFTGYQEGNIIDNHS